jgi:lipopolysaccharide transport system permease protein
MFVWRDFIALYKQTILGPLWHLVQPILMAITYGLVFGKIAKLSVGGSPIFIFYFSSIILWTYFANCMNSTATTFVTNAPLLGKVYFPRLVLPISIVLSNLIAFGIQLLLLGILMVIYTFLDANFHITWYLLGLPIILMMTAILGMGLGIIVAAITVRYRDLAHLVKFGTQLLMFITPVIYPITTVPPKYHFIVTLNPLAPLFEFYRLGIIGKGELNISEVAISLLASCITLVIGLIMFNRSEKTFMDHV